MANLTSAEIRAMRAQAMRDGASVFWPVAQAVADEFGVTLSQITCPTRSAPHVALARAWVCRCANDRGLSISAIARLLGRDHSSVSAAIARTREDEPTITFKSRRAQWLAQ